LSNYSRRDVTQKDTGGILQPTRIFLYINTKKKG